MKHQVQAQAISQHRPTRSCPARNGTLRPRRMRKATASTCQQGLVELKLKWDIDSMTIRPAWLKPKISSKCINDILIPLVDNSINIMALIRNL